MRQSFKSFLLLGAFFLTLAMIAGATNALDYSHVQKAPATDKIKIVTTTAHIADLVRNVAGNTARVESIMKGDVDPHLYRPVRSDIQKVLDADIVFYNGQHLEGQMVEFFHKLEQQKPVYSISAATQSLIKDEDGAYDPHIWMDVRNWVAAADYTSKALSNFAPNKKSYFNENSNTYSKKLNKLHSYIQNTTATIPPKNRTLITAHDAFGYYGDAYGIEVHGIQGLSTSSEAGLREIEDLVSFISSQKIPAIFLEMSVSDQNIRAVLEGVRARGHNVALGGSLFSDSLGKPGTFEGSYIGMMAYNTRNIVESLGGQATTFGMDDGLASLPDDKPVIP